MDKILTPTDIDKDELDRVLDEIRKVSQQAEYITTHCRNREEVVRGINASYHAIHIDENCSQLVKHYQMKNRPYTVVSVTASLIGLMIPRTKNVALFVSFSCMLVQFMLYQHFGSYQSQDYRSVGPLLIRKDKLKFPQTRTSQMRWLMFTLQGLLLVS